jgi:hypothetical protein
MSENEKTIDNNSGQKAKRQRSPGFPILPIDDAITRLKLIYQHDKRSFTTADAILSHLGYKGGVRSGTAGRIVSALRQYGVLDENGGRFRVSDLGFKILHLEEGSDERNNLIKEAALNPPIFKKLLAYYEGDPPSDAALRSHLVLNERFNTDSVEQFIRVFRKTISIANPSPDDYNIGEESEGADSSLFGGMPMSAPTQHTSRPMGMLSPPPLQQASPTVPPLAAGDSVLVFKISRDSEARVIFNGQVTQEAIDKLAALLNLSKDVYPTAAELQANFLKNLTTDPSTGKPYMEGASKEKIANVVNSFTQAGKSPDEQ